MASDPKNELTEEEAQRRFEEAVKAGLKTPPKPLKEKLPVKSPKENRK
jgi:hypothetical protein